MPSVLSRLALQAVAEAKLADAMLLLLANGRFANAYYLAGYAVEIALQACIARQVVAETLPERGFVNEIFRHELKRLASLAGLTGELRHREARDAEFAANWATVAEWRPDVRYTDVGESAAQSMLSAVGDPNAGVLPWIRTYW